MDLEHDSPEKWRQREAQLDNVKVALRIARRELRDAEAPLAPMRAKVKALAKRERQLSAWVLSNNPDYRSVLYRARWYVRTMVDGPGDGR